MKMKRLLALSLLLALPAQADTFARPDIETNPTPQRFSVCYNGSCKEVAQVSIGAQDWQRVTAPLRAPAADAAAERQQIASAVALMEQVVGTLTDTAHDKGRNDIGGPADNWMDCIDESTNTTSYLRMFAREGLLRHHTVEDRQTRGWFLFGYPHTSAVIRERDNGREYAVDSWFHDNGVAPEIVPVEVWHAGWNPPPDTPKPAAAVADPQAPEH